MPSDAHAQQLSAAVSTFKIGNRTWNIGDTLHSIGTKVIEKRKMVETFGAQFETIFYLFIYYFATPPRGEPSSSPRPEGAGPPSTLEGGGLV